MKWKKSPDALVARFDQVLPRDAAVERRSMFGYPCAFLQGNMFCGLYQDRFILRLPDDARAQFLKQPGASIFEPMPGRPMKEYVVVPPVILESDRRIGPWARRSLDYVSTLPPRQAKARKAASAKKRKAPAAPKRAR